MKIKTADLIGPALDWAVAKCEGLLCFGYRTDGERLSIQSSDGEVGGFAPSTNWAEAGPLIERKKLSVVIQRVDAWHSSCPRYVYHGYGPTPLIAAMRCFVASRLGDEVDVPDELMEKA